MSATTASATSTVPAATTSAASATSTLPAATTAAASSATVAVDNNNSSSSSSSSNTSKSGSIGVFVHWGLYSGPAFDSVASARRRRRQNGSEWYYPRLLAKASDRWPPSGWHETQHEHQKRYGTSDDAADYFALFGRQFTAARWNPNDWVDEFARGEASYVVLTARHHDGFCLWPSRVAISKKTITSTTAAVRHKDLVQELSVAVRARGLKFGLYYSWFEADVRPTVQYFKTVVEAQLKELAETYRPDIVWFDGDWMCKTASLLRCMEECVSLLRKWLPNVHINDRVGSKARGTSATELGLSDFRVYDDRTIPERDPGVPWEHCNTIGISWGRNKEQSATHDYKSGEDLYRLWKRVSERGGRFLLNFGPDAEGQLDPNERHAWQVFHRHRLRADTRPAQLDSRTNDTGADLPTTIEAPVAAD